MRNLHLLKSIGLASALASLFLSQAIAADGSCEASYSKQVGAPGQFRSHGWYTQYHTQNTHHGGYSIGIWPEGQEPPFPYTWNGVSYPRATTLVWRILMPMSFPTSFRENFTSAARENAWTIPAGENSSWWTRKAMRNYPGTAPVAAGGGYGVTSNYSTAEVDGGAYVGTWVHSKMPADASTDPLAPEIYPDPQQHAIRFVVASPQGAGLNKWNFSHSPDINVADETVRAAAETNASTVTETTMERLRDYVERGVVDRNFLDLKPGVTIRAQSISYANNQWWRNAGGYVVENPWSKVDAGSVQEDCALFAEIVKHPRLDDVYMLKYFIRTAVIDGMGPGYGMYSTPFSVHQKAQTFIAYAPYTITINQKPELQDDAASTNYRTPITVNVLANDLDPDEGPEPLKLTALDTPAEGALTWQPDGAVTYTPAGEWMGEVTLDYTATDGASEETATLRITVNDEGLEPVAENDVFVTTWDKPITLQPLSNDVVPEMLAMSISSIGTPARGSAMINSDRQSIRYIPVSGLTGSFSFPYTISDTKKTSSATITVVVREPDNYRDDWEPKPFNYEDWCRTADGKARQGGYSDDCWKMMRDTKPIPN